MMIVLSTIAESHLKAYNSVEFRKSSTLHDAFEQLTASYQVHDQVQP